MSDSLTRPLPPSFLDEDDDAMVVGRIQCQSCRHLHNLDGEGIDGSQTCEAFPGGIPWQIWLGEHDHSYPYPNDRGIRFEYQSELADG